MPIPGWTQLLIPLIQPLIEGIRGLWQEYGQMIMGYVKGRQEQKTADRLKTSDTYNKQSSKITERIEEHEQNRKNHEFGDGTVNDRVRRSNGNDKPVQW